MKRHLRKMFRRLSMAIGVTATVLLLSEYFMATGDIRVIRPEWTQSGHTVSGTRVMEYIQTGKVRNGDNKTFISKNTDYTAILKMKTLRYLDQPPIRRYSDVYTVDAGDRIYFIRTVISDARHHISVERKISLLDVDGPPSAGAMRAVDYNINKGSDTSQYWFTVDPCTTPGRYLFRSVAVYEVRFLGQSIFTKLISLPLPTIVFTVRPPIKILESCMANLTYRNYIERLRITKEKS